MNRQPGSPLGRLPSQNLPHTGSSMKIGSSGQLLVPMATNATMIAEIARQVCHEGGGGGGIASLMKCDTTARCVLETAELANAVPLHGTVVSTPVSGETSIRWIVFYTSSVVGTRVVESIPVTSILAYSTMNSNDNKRSMSSPVARSGTGDSRGVDDLNKSVIALCFAKTTTQYALITKIGDPTLFDLIINEAKMHADLALDFTDGSGATVFSSISSFRSTVLKHVKSKKIVKVLPEALIGVENLGKTDAMELALSRHCGRVLSFCIEGRLKMYHRAGLMGEQYKPRIFLHTLTHFIAVKKTKMASPIPYLYVPWTSVVRILVDSTDARLLAVHIETEPLQIRSIVLQFDAPPHRRMWIESCSSTCAQLYHAIVVDTGVALDPKRVPLLTRRGEDGGSGGGGGNGTGAGSPTQPATTSDAAGGGDATSGGHTTANTNYHQILATRVLVDELHAHRAGIQDFAGSFIRHIEVYMFLFTVSLDAAVHSTNSLAKDMMSFAAVVVSSSSERGNEQGTHNCSRPLTPPLSGSLMVSQSGGNVSVLAQQQQLQRARSASGKKTLRLAVGEKPPPLVQRLLLASIAAESHISVAAGSVTIPFTRTTLPASILVQYMRDALVELCQVVMDSLTSSGAMSESNSQQVLSTQQSQGGSPSGGGSGTSGGFQLERFVQQLAASDPPQEVWVVLGLCEGYCATTHIVVLIVDCIIRPALRTMLLGETGASMAHSKNNNAAASPSSSPRGGITATTSTAGGGIGSSSSGANFHLDPSEGLMIAPANDHVWDTLVSRWENLPESFPYSNSIKFIKSVCSDSPTEGKKEPTTLSNNKNEKDTVTDIDDEHSRRSLPKPPFSGSDNGFLDTEAVTSVTGILSRGLAPLQSGSARSNSGDTEGIVAGSLTSTALATVLGDAMAPHLRPLRRLYTVGLHFCPKMLANLMEGAAALNHATYLRQTLMKTVTQLGKTETATQTIRKSAQEEKLHKSYHELLSQQVFDSENEKRLQREVPLLKNEIVQLEKKVQMMETQNVKLQQEITHERELRRTKEAAIESEAEQISILREENDALTQQLKVLKVKTPQLIEMNEQLRAEAVMVFLESELNGRQKIGLSERQERFEMMTLLIGLFS